MSSTAGRLAAQPKEASIATARLLQQLSLALRFLDALARRLAQRRRLASSRLQPRLRPQHCLGSAFN